MTAQKPDSTGSGTYLAQVAFACERAGHVQGIVAGVTHEDHPTLPQSARFYPVYFEGEDGRVGRREGDLPFPIVGMSDDMPYRSTRYRDLTPEMVERFRAAFGQAIGRAVVELKPEVIFCHHLYLLTAFVRELVDDIPVVGLSHSTDLRQLRQHGLERDRIKAGIRRLDHPFALHEEQRREIVELFEVEPERVSVLGTGYDAATFHITDATASRPIDLLYVGKLCFKKGVPSFLSALELIDARGSGADGHLAVRLAGGMGQPRELAEVERLIAQSSHDVRWLGKLSPAELAEVYRSSRWFVLPSFFEGLPLVTIEAMACGCGVVVTDLPGIRPWMDAVLPEAPVSYVAPPPLRDLDLPVPGSLPDFERRLARSLEEALACEVHPVRTEDLSWDGVATRLIEQLGETRRL